MTKIFLLNVKLFNFIFIYTILVLYKGRMNDKDIDFL